MKKSHLFLTVLSFLLLGAAGLHAQFVFPRSQEVILMNSDREDKISSLRLQKGSTQGWLMTNRGNELEWSFSTNSNSSNTDHIWGMPGTRQMSLELGQGLTLNHNLWVDSGTISLGSSPRQMINLFGTAYGIGVQSSTQYFRTGSNFAWFRGGSHNTNLLNPGGGTMDMVLKQGVLGVGVSNTDLNMNVRAHIGGDLQVDGAATIGNMKVGSSGGLATLIHSGISDNASGTKYGFAQTQLGTSVFNGATAVIICIDGFNAAENVRMQIGDSSVEVKNSTLIAEDYLAVGTAEEIDNTVAHFGGSVYMDGDLNISGKFHSKVEGKHVLIANEEGDLMTLHNPPGADNSTLIVGRLLEPLPEITRSFAVAGNAIMDALKIAHPSSWSDFVFAPDYDLKSLEEVEVHIQEKGHLPDVPSEQELIDQGYYDQHEINKVLLQKIEELTLYVIEQNKEIKRLKENAKAAAEN